jgi:hypothetical protein
MSTVGVRLLSEGFLRPVATLESELADDSGIVHVPVHGLDADFQFFQCRVEDAGGVMDYVLTDAGSPANADIVQRVLSARFPGCVVLFLRSQAIGRAVVEHKPVAPLAFPAAAAVATVLRAAAWDESESFSIEGGGERHIVAISAEDSAYVARARAAAPL